MARPWRIQYKDAYYHVLSRGSEGRAIFYDDQDRRIFLDTLGEASDRFGAEIFAFVLMTNHYHLLLQTRGADLSRVMQWVGVAYSRRFNNRHSRAGHLFQGRFKSMVVENDAYVVELSCYIHRNPLRAGMVERLIDYQWSSYPGYAYGHKGPEWLKTDLILGYFSGEDSRKAYRDKVQAYAGEEKRLWEDLRHGLILGTSQFLDSIKTKYAQGRPHREIPQQRGVVGRAKAEALLRQTFGDGSRNGGRLYGKKKEERDLWVFLLWKAGSYTNGEIGEIFGIGYTAVSHIVKEARNRMKSDHVFQRDYALLNSQLKI